MDFGQFNTTSGAEEGRFLHLRHLVTGEPLYDEDEDGTRRRVGLTVRGMESKTLRKAINKYRRRSMTSSEDVDGEMEIAKALVLSFHNIERDGKPLTTSVEDLTWFFDQSREFVRAVIDFANTSGNFVSAG